MTRYKNIVFTVVVILFSYVMVHAQIVEAPKLKEIKGKKLLEEMIPLQHKKGLWGYANSEGKFIIKPVFNEVCPFEENLARVCVDGKWGTISRNGLYIVTPSFDEIKEFSEDSLAIVKYNGEYGIIDAKGGVVQSIVYTSIDYADYGYLVKIDELFGTLDTKGNVILEPQFENVVMFEQKDSLEMFSKGGKWGVMLAGREILAHKWGKKLELFLRGGDGRPNLYLVSQNRRYGIVTPFGDYVVPCIYDEIALASSGKYCITRRDDKYGAMNLNMEEIISPILEEKPVLGEEIFRTYDGGKFYCVNYKGAIDFRNCADLYSMFKPEEYITTTTFPEWAKTHLIEKNLQSRQMYIDKARKVCEIMGRYGYDIDKAHNDKNLPDGIALNYPKSAIDKYGISVGNNFIRSSGNVTAPKIGNCDVLYKTENADVSLVSDSSGSKYYIKYNSSVFPIEEMLLKFNVKQVKSLYPQSFVKLSDSTILILFAFIRSAADVDEPLTDTNQYFISAEKYNVVIHKGAPQHANETRAAVVFNADNLSAVSFAQMPDNTNNIVARSISGGFFTYSKGNVIVDMESSLVKYDRNGILDWEFRPSYGEKFYDIEETENYIYLSGSTINGTDSGAEIPLLLQLSKRGKTVKSFTKNYLNARFSGVVCKDYLLYLKTDFAKEKILAPDFLPHYVLEDLGDNVGVRIKCVWEQWGNALIGGCGIISEDGRWLSSPVLSTDQMSVSFDWEYSGFANDYLVIRHMGKYGIINKAGVMTVDTKYDFLEELDNPSYFRAKLNNDYGVINAEGRVIVPFEYRYVGNMSEDIIVVSKDGFYGCYDKSGKLTVPLESEEIREYIGGMARVRQNRKFGFIDKSGHILVNPFSDEVENFSEGAALVTLKDKKGFVTLQGDWITPPMYDSGTSFSDGFATVELKGKYGYIDKNGDVVIPMQFSDARPFNPDCKLASVAKDGKWGVVKIRENTAGNGDVAEQYGKGIIVVPLIYDEVAIYSDGYVLVQKDNKYGIISESGSEIYPVVCDSIECNDKDRLFTNGVVTARINGERVRIDILGNTVYPYIKFVKHNF